MADQKNNQDPLDVEEALMTSEAFLFKYKNIIVGVVVAIVVIVCGTLGYKHFISEPNELKASEASFMAERYFGNDEFEVALKGDSLGNMGFLKIADEFSGTKAGKLANAYAGVCYAKLAQYEDAAKYLDKFSASDAQLGQLDKAAATLLKAAEKANSVVLSPVYLLEAGQILEKQGKNSEAVEAYKQIKNKYGNSMQAMDIDKYIDRASIK